jgi:hypothetical protein
VTLTARWLEQPPTEWDSLRRSDPAATPIHRPELARALAAVLPGYSAHWIAVERDGGLVGGAPAMIERRAGLHWIHAMPWALSGAPLAQTGLHAAVDETVAAAIDRRAAELRAVGGAWVLYRPNQPEIARETLERIPGETHAMTTAVIDLAGGVEAAFRAVARRTRYEIRATHGRALTCAEDPDALDEAYALYRAQARRWPGHRPRPLELLRRLLLDDPPAARLFAARDARGLLTAGLVLIGDREWMWWWSGSHPEARVAHATSRLMWSTVEGAAAAGCTRLNLGASAGLASVEAFKLGLGARDLPVIVRWIAPVHAGAVGRAVAGLQARIRARRARGAPA